MKIVLTGCTGFVGKNLIESLLNENYDLYAIVRPTSNKRTIKQEVNTFVYDQNIEELVNYFKNNQFDGVIHLASLFLSSHIPNDIVNLINSNIRFGTEILEACKQSRVNWFINTGTFWQNYQNQNYNPVNLYAATKEAFENIAKYYTETSDLIFTTLKLNDTFGPGDERKKILNLWEAIATSGEMLEMSPGDQVLDICYIKDVIKAYNIMIQHLSSKNSYNFNNKSYVVSSEEKVTLKKFSEIFEEITETKLNIKWGAKPYREREVMFPFDKGEIVPGWKQEYSLQRALSEMFKK